MSKNVQRTVLVDQDGVLADYPKKFLEILSERYPHINPISYDNLANHDIIKNYPKTVEAEAGEIDLEKGFYRSLSPILGGKEVLEYLLHLGHDVRICTAPKRRFHNCVLEKFEWIEEHLGQKWIERTILTRDKTFVRGDILIDDKPEIIGACTPTWKHVLYDQPYNRHLADRPRITWANYEILLRGLV